MRYEDKEAWSSSLAWSQRVKNEPDMFYMLDCAPYTGLDLASVLESPNAIVTDVNGL